MAIAMPHDLWPLFKALGVPDLTTKLVMTITPGEPVEITATFAVSTPEGEPMLLDDAIVELTKTFVLVDKPEDAA